jgi:hypothetical protein
MVRKLNRRGYAVVPITGGDMSGNSEIKGLTQIINEDVAKLRDKAAKLHGDLGSQLTAAHEALTYAEDLTSTLRDAVADLRGALGQHSNNPPKEDERAPTLNVDAHNSRTEPGKL